MISFNVKTDIDRVSAQIRDKFRSQIPFATALALTRTAQDVQQEIVAELPTIFDRPTPWTMKAFKVIQATKSTLTASVQIQPSQAKYLQYEIAGGVRVPMSKAIVLPTDIPLDQYGNMPRSTVKRLLARPDVFSGKVRGIAGIWQRKGRQLILLIDYQPKVTYRPIFDFVGIAQRVITARILPNFSNALGQAIATAR